MWHTNWVFCEQTSVHQLIFVHQRLLLYIHLHSYHNRKPKCMCSFSTFCDLLLTVQQAHQMTLVHNQYYWLCTRLIGCAWTVKTKTHYVPKLLNRQNSASTNEIYLNGWNFASMVGNRVQKFIPMWHLSQVCSSFMGVKNQQFLAFCPFIK